MDAVTTICLPTAAAVALLGQPPGIDVLVWDGVGDPPSGLEDVALLVGGYAVAPLPAQALARMPKLAAVQLLSAGVETWLGHVPDGVLLCNGRGVHTASTAELAVGGMLSWLRELPRFAADQAAHRWAPARTRGLAGTRVLIVGAGDIGRRIAAAVVVFDAIPTLVASHARESVHGVAELAELLPRHDIVVIAVPRTPQTEQLVDAEFLAAMPDGALLVNIARGPIVDTAALLAELRARRLSAFLDVTDPEPLPSEHLLWEAPNLVLTPHVGGGTTGWERRAYQLVREQVLRLHHGQALYNVVVSGY